MSVYVFIGPTLTAAEAAPLLDAVYLPPAAHGDVYRAALRRPRAIGIVDGLFDCIPSIWHKEILWAMSQGIHVFGSASMGALRAVELAAFGMQGVGATYAAYASGELEDDDEVAVAHGPAEAGYRPLSEALVNMRATLAAAAACGVIASATATALLELARAVFYVERSYQRLLHDAAARGLPGQELAALGDWLPHGRVDQKRADALAMLCLMREQLAAEPAPKRVSYHFEHTVFWDRVRRGARPVATDTRADLRRDMLLDELRLDPHTYQRLRAAALGRGLANVLADRVGHTPHPDKVHEQIEDLRSARGLEHSEALRQWLAARDLSAEALADLMHERAQLAWAASSAVPDLAERLLDELRLDEGYLPLRDRALDKQRMLDSTGLAESSLLDAGLSRDELLIWFFTVRMDQAVPADLWLYVREHGYHDEDMFIRAALHEYHYEHRGGSWATGTSDYRLLATDHWH